MIFPGQSVRRRMIRMMHIISKTDILNHSVLMCHEPMIFSLL